MKKLRVFLIDDHAVVREGLKHILENEPGVAIAGEAESGAEALQTVPRARPDVVVMDISMAGLSGARLCRALLQKSRDLIMLVLTVHEDKSYLRELMEAGARGYVLKRTAGDELIRAIRSVAEGNVYIDPRVAGKLVDSSLRQRKQGGFAQAPLSERESTVLRLLARGYSNKEIGGILGLSVKTIETYKGRSMGKLGLRSRVDVVRYAHDSGWLAGGTE